MAESRKRIDWKTVIAKLRKQPGRWVVLSEMVDVSERTTQIINKRKNRTLRLEDGVIRHQRRATAYDIEGRKTVTLALMFDLTPPEPPKENS